MTKDWNDSVLYGCKEEKEAIDMYAKLKDYEYSRTVMVGRKGLCRLANKLGGKILAFVTWKINRFANKAHNDKDYNRDYFQKHQSEIESINEFLVDDYSKEIYRKCMFYRVSHNVADQPDYNKKNQYFVQDIIRLQENEVFIDCGAYTGDTIEAFRKYSRNHYKSIIAFEPSEKNIAQINKMDDRLCVIQKGVWDQNEILFFKEDGEGSSIVNERDRNHNRILCCRLDDCDCCQEATFIKMDIEGAELNALIGAENIIRKNHPKLAICIYHAAEDMVQIPIYLHEKYPFYSFYIRHHSHRCAETVLYCIPAL